MILGLHTCSEEAYTLSNFQANRSRILTKLPVWKRPNLLKSSWRKGFGLGSRQVWLNEIMVNLGPNHVLKCLGCGLGIWQICCEQKMCVFVGERGFFFFLFFFSCVHKFLSLYSFLFCCLCHNLRWPQTLYSAAPCRFIIIHCTLQTVRVLMYLTHCGINRH